MLTNTTKSRFVKVLALILASLMVLVCFAGCTDSDAQAAAADAQKTADDAAKKADDAQKTADTKTTTEAVAEQIKNALKDYLKTADAVDTAAVNKLIDDAVKALDLDNKYDKKGTAADLTKDLGTFAKSSELAALAGQLADYAKKSDIPAAGLTDKQVEDKITAKITAALADYALKAEVEATYTTQEFTMQVWNVILANFYTKDVVNQLLSTKADKSALDAYLNAEQTNARINELLGGYYTKTQIDAFLNGITPDTFADLDDRIEALEDIDVVDKAALAVALANYVKAEEFNDFVEDYFSDAENGSAAAKLAKVSKIMELEDWEDATDVILDAIKRIDDLAAFLKEVNNTRIYTDTRKAEIEGYLSEIFGASKLDYTPNHGDTPKKKAANYALFEKVGGKRTYIVRYKNGQPDTTGTVAQGIDFLKEAALIRFLRATSLEDIAGMIDAIDKAMKVPTFDQDRDFAMSKLFGLGKATTVATVDFDPNKKWSDLKPTEKANGVQIVTIKDRENFLQYTKELDNLFVAYAADKAFSYADTPATKYNTYKDWVVYDAYQKETYDGTKWNFTANLFFAAAPTSYTGTPVNGSVRYTKLNVQSIAVDYSADGSVGYLPVNFEKAAFDHDAEIKFMPASVTTQAGSVNILAAMGTDLPEIKAAYGKVWNDYKTDKAFASEADFTAVSYQNKGIQAYVAAKYTGSATTDFKADVRKYGAIVAMLDNCRLAIKNASDKFAAKEPTGKYAETAFLGNAAFTGCTTDAQYVDALQATLCEPADKTVAATTGMWLTPGQYANVNDTVRKYMVEALWINDLGNVAAADIETKYDLDKYQLYLAMMDKSNSLLFGLYQGRALDALNKLLADYISIVHTANGVALGDMQTALGANVAWTDDGSFLTAIQTGACPEGRDYFPREMTTNKYSKYKKDGFYLEAIEAFNSNVPLYDSTTGYGIYDAHTLQTIKNNSEKVKYYFGAVTVSVRKAIEQKKLSDVTSDTTVYEVFCADLDNATNNLNEVLKVFLLEDYKKAAVSQIYGQIFNSANIINDMTWANGKPADTDVIANGMTAADVNALGYVAFFIDNIDPNRLVAFDGYDTYDAQAILNNTLQYYIAGYLTYDAVNPDDEDYWENWTEDEIAANPNFYQSAIDYCNRCSKYCFDNNIVLPTKSNPNPADKAHLVKMLADVQLPFANVDQWAVTGANVPMVGTAALKEMDTTIKNFKEDMYNVVIRFMFDSYMDRALDELLKANGEYKNSEGFVHANTEWDAELRRTLSMVYNDEMEAITIDRLNNKAGEIAIEDYTAKYTDTLKQIVDKNDIRVIFIGKTFSELVQEIAAAKKANLNGEIYYTQAVVDAMPSGTTEQQNAKAAAQLKVYVHPKCSTAGADAQKPGAYQHAGATVAKFSKVINGVEGKNTARALTPAQLAAILAD